MQFEVRVTGDVDRLAALPAEALKALQDGLKRSAYEIEAHAKANVVDRLNTTGQATGALASSIHVQMDADSLTARIGSPLVYAAIHELGGTIVPRTAKVLHWVDASGQDHWAQKVTIPARPWLRPALYDSAALINKEFLSPFREMMR